MGETATQEILLKVAADVDSAIANLRKLSEEGTKGSEGMVLGLADVKAGLDLMASAYGAAKEAIADFAKDARNEHASMGISIEGLRESTKGLINDDDLLALAAKSNQSQFRLTQAQLEGVGAAMVAARNKSHDLHQVQANFADFLSTGNTKALREYGINVAETSRTQEGFNEGLRKAIGMGKEAGATTEQMGDDFFRAGVRLDNALDQLKDSIAAIAIEMAPVVQLTADLVHAVSGPGFLEAQKILMQVRSGQIELDPIKAGFAAWANNSVRDVVVQAEQSIAALQRGHGREAEGEAKRAIEGFKAGFAALERFGKGGGGGGKPLAASSVEFGVWGTARAPEPSADMLMQGGGGPGVFGTERESRRVGSTEVGFAQGGLDFSSPAFKQQFTSLTEGERASNKALADEKWWETQRASSAAFQSQLLLTSEAFGMFKDAAVDAFAQVGAGTLSLGDAFGKLAGKFLMGQGTKLIGVAIEEGVMALVSLANLDFVGAGAHGIAAAKAAAGSVALFALAQGLGVTGSSPSANAGGGGGGGGGGGAAPTPIGFTGYASAGFASNALRAGLGKGSAQQGGPSAGPASITIVVGSDWGERSQSQRAASVRNALTQANVPIDPNAVVFSG